MSPYISILKEAGFRSSKAAAKILEEMSRCPHPLSLSQLGERLSLHDWNESTIYRCVTRLLEAGLLRRITLRGRSAYYELTIGKHGSAYLVCDQCGECSSTEPAAFTEVVEQLRQQAQWKNTYFELSLHGVCPDCSEKGQPTGAHSVA